MAVKSVSIRIEEAMLKKIGYVADYEGRSINSHILCLIRDDIKAFEKRAWSHLWQYRRGRECQAAEEVEFFWETQQLIK